MLTLEIFTDGACRGNPGLGGWGAVLCYPSLERKLYGFTENTTNNQMELTACIMALKSLEQSYHIHLHTDSQYVQKGMTQWLKNWKERNWVTSASKPKPVKNKNLWQALAELSQKHIIQWIWVKGHNGHQYNEMADRLANQAINDFLANKD